MPAADPLTAPGAADRLAVLRTLCAGLIGAMVGVTFLIVLVVQFALDGQPLAGNAVRFADVAAVTWVALAAAAAAPPAALVLSAARTRAGSAAADPDAVLDLFAAVTFVESAVPLAAGVGCALLYHITADPLLLAAVGGLAGFLLTRLPTTTRAGRWFARFPQDSPGPAESPAAVGPHPPGPPAP